MWDYFNHVKQSPAHEPFIYFTSDSRIDNRNPWRTETPLAEWDIEQADILILAGMDWTGLNEAQRADPPVPILNLIQHVRHADPDDPRSAFLKHRAIRLCVSEEIADALRETGQVNGPILVVPMGVDRSLLPEPRPFHERSIDLLIIGVKRPRLAAVISWHLAIRGVFSSQQQKNRIRLLSTPVPRSEFLEALNDAKTTLFLPNPTEGFYLPALEGMALGTLVICPDCVGNRSFCLPGETCLRPLYTEKAMVQSVLEARALLETTRKRMLENAQLTSSRHTLKRERAAFLSILDEVDSLW